MQRVVGDGFEPEHDLFGFIADDEEWAPLMIANVKCLNEVILFIRIMDRDGSPCQISGQNSHGEYFSFFV